MSLQWFQAARTCLSWKMWSGLLPPGLNESDVDLSSDDGDELHSSFSQEDANDDLKRVQLSELQGNGPESSGISEPIAIPVADGEDESQRCPSGVPLSIWNVGIITLVQMSRV